MELDSQIQSLGLWDKVFSFHCEIGNTVPVPCHMVTQITDVTDLQCTVLSTHENYDYFCHHLIQHLTVNMGKLRPTEGTLPMMQTARMGT